MNSCRILTRSLIAFSLVGFLAGCVPYERYEEEKLRADQAVKSLDDLRSRHNRLLAMVNGPQGDGTAAQKIRFLEGELAARERELDELKNLPFERGDEASVTYSELGPKGQLVLSDLLFRSGSADIGPKGRAALDGLAGLLKTKYPGEAFHLVGHTDNDPIQKSGFEDNLDLGGARAKMVFKYLKQEHGFSESQFGYTSYGASKPKVPNTTAENKAQNRRVEVFRIGSAF